MLDSNFHIFFSDTLSSLLVLYFHTNGRLAMSLLGINFMQSLREICTCSIVPVLAWAAHAWALSFLMILHG